MKYYDLENSEGPLGIALGVEIVLLIIVLGISKHAAPISPEPSLGIKALILSLIVTLIILSIVVTLLTLAAKTLRSH